MSTWAYFRAAYSRLIFTLRYFGLSFMLLQNLGTLSYSIFLVYFLSCCDISAYSRALQSRLILHVSRNNWTLALVPHCFEQSTDEDGLRTRIRHTFAQCLSHMWHFCEFWYDLAEYEYALGESERAARVYRQAVTVSKLRLLAAIMQRA